MTMQDELLLVLNVGSSSVKFSIFNNQEQPQLKVRGQVDGLPGLPRLTVRDNLGHPLDTAALPAEAPGSHVEAVRTILAWIVRHFDSRPIQAVGHRVVHGGALFDRPVRIDEHVLAQLESLNSLAPLHQPHHVAGIHAVAQALPATPQVACFDTAFHATQAAVERMYALPQRFYDLGIQRYGFHGLSYEYIAGKLAELDPVQGRGRVVVAHLGSGCSMCALRDGKSQATSMGFSTLDGLPMGTRVGGIDPGVLLYLLRMQEFTVEQLQQMLYEQSGLLGISGLSGDMRTLLQHESTDARAALAIEYFVYRIQRELGSLVAVLGGLDCLVFCGGIGESSPTIRERICRQASWIGLKLNSLSNRSNFGRVSDDDSAVHIWVVPTNEELMIARHTRALLAQ